MIFCFQCDRAVSCVICDRASPRPFFLLVFRKPRTVIVLVLGCEVVKARRVNACIIVIVACGTGNLGKARSCRSDSGFVLEMTDTKESDSHENQDDGNIEHGFYAEDCAKFFLSTEHGNSSIRVFLPFCRGCLVWES